MYTTFFKGHKLLLGVLSIITFGTLWAQKTKLSSGHSASLHWRAYQLAKKNNDMQAARVALYYALAEDPTNLAIKDTLAISYFSSGIYEQSILLGKELIENKPNDIRLLSMLAFAYGALGATRESLEYYEKVYKLTGSAYHLYQVAILQFTMRRFGECAQSIEKLLQSPQAEIEKVYVPKKGGKEQQEISIRAAAFYVEGQLWKEQKEQEKAKNSFEQALKLEPNFELAASMLQELKELEKK
ncbi:MAG: hypothetical protein RML72_05765 [Bacteroidia bacterium]|nr:hypothetical protein [Bacteroidia bacterium]MDW8158368.1 hypothetical protein [Bacteroidia bacterium]